MTLRKPAFGRRRSLRADCGNAAGGFTLVELVSLLAVVAILSGLAVPSLGWLGSARQNIAGGRVRTALAFAQQWAMGSGRGCWADFDVVQGRLSIYVEQDQSAGARQRVVMEDPLTRGPMVVQLGVDGVAFESVDFGGSESVRFDAEGTPHAGGGAALSSDGTVALTGGIRVRVAHGTGLVTVD